MCGACAPSIGSFLLQQSTPMHSYTLFTLPLPPTGAHTHTHAQVHRITMLLLQQPVLLCLGELHPGAPSTHTVVLPHALRLCRTLSLPVEEMALLASKDANWLETDASELKQRISVSGSCVCVHSCARMCTCVRKT